VTTAPARPPAYAAFGRIHRAGSEGGIEALSHLSRIDAQGLESVGRVNGGSQGWTDARKIGSGGVHIKAAGSQHGGCSALPVAQQPQHQVFVGQAWMSECLGFGVGQPDNLATSGIEPRPHGGGSVFAERGLQPPRHSRPHHDPAERVRSPCL
jgi:hypothetical protein